MWDIDLPELGALTPSEGLWVIAQGVEENGGPHQYVMALRRLAERLQECQWWLAEPNDLRITGLLGGRPPTAPHQLSRLD